MGNVFAVTNQKGGVGKTTTTVNLAASLAENGKKILLVDLDPQGNASTGCGINGVVLEKSSYDVIMGEASAAEVIVKRDDFNFDVMPTNSDLTAAEVELLDEDLREHQLRLALEPIRADYDFILIDCPPSLSMLTLNALVASKGVIIPVQCEYYALEGLSSLLKTVERVITHFERKVFHALIPRNVRLAEAPSHGVPVLDYDRSSRGSIAYMALASEFMRREKS